MERDTAAASGSVAVSDGEAVYHRGIGKAVGLVQHALAVLAVQDGDVRGGVALRELGFVAGKTAVQAHAINHLERVGGDGVAVIDTLRHPDVGRVHLCEAEGIGDAAERVAPTCAGVVARTIHLHVDDISVFG